MKPDKKIRSINRFIGTTPSVLWGLLVVITVVFSIVLYPEKGTLTLSYQLGDVAERDIKAPKDFFIEDQAATEQNRKDILKTVLSVYDYDPNLAKDISTRVTNAFQVPQKLFPPEAPEAPTLAVAMASMEKSQNMISRTGRIPFMAAPIETPVMAFSAMGVFSTRSSPNSCTRPTVWPNTPTRTSSPITKTLGSRRISSASASLIACR